MSPSKRQASQKLACLPKGWSQTHMHARSPVAFKLQISSHTHIHMHARSLVASKLKISSIPPPHHSGPPLNLPSEYLPPVPAGDSVSERPWGSEVSTTVSEAGVGQQGSGTAGGPPDKDAGKGAGAGHAGRGGGSSHTPLLPLPPSPPSRSDNFLTTAANFGSNLLSSAAAMAAAALGAGTAASSSAPPVSQQQELQQQPLVSASSLSFQGGACNIAPLGARVVSSVPSLSFQEGCEEKEIGVCVVAQNTSERLEWSLCRHPAFRCVARNRVMSGPLLAY
eukprot:1158975-Pelagomonas_calceolata.AAC.13